MPIHRFLEYVCIPTMSCEDSTDCPSTPGQLQLAQRIALDLQEIGMQDVHIDENGYLTATLPNNTDKDLPVLGFIAHMDTSPDAPDRPVHPRMVLYDGTDIPLDAQAGLYLRESEYSALAAYRGKHLIVTDEHTLLGADDKAGIAEIVAALAYLARESVPHGKIRVCFTPDEEIGRGADHFAVDAFGADFAYTVDGGPIGELSFENFNAASAVVTIHGVCVHPGDARNKMKNALRIAMEFDALLDPTQIPEKTQGYEGFHHLTALHGDVESASLSYIIRDHDAEKFAAKKYAFQLAAERINSRYGSDTLELSLQDSYYNMAQVMQSHMRVVERADAAMRAVGILPRVEPIRGGTDGARLSYAGLPCPNLCTGGENFHSRFEFICAEDMKQIMQMLVELARRIVDEV